MIQQPHSILRKTNQVFSLEDKVVEEENESDAFTLENQKETGLKQTKD